MVIAVVEYFRILRLQRAPFDRLRADGNTLIKDNIFKAVHGERGAVEPFSNTSITARALRQAQDERK